MPACCNVAAAIAGRQTLEADMADLRRNFSTIGNDDQSGPAEQTKRRRRALGLPPLSPRSMHCVQHSPRLVQRAVQEAIASK